MLLIWPLINVNSFHFAFINFVIESRFPRSASTLGKVMSPKAEMGIVIVSDKPSTFLSSLSFTIDAAKSLQSCPILCDPMDQSPSGSSVHEILQAKILDWVPTPSSRGSSQPRDQIHVFNVSCVGRGILSTSTIWESPEEGNGYPL